jgi:hypothetical protein
MTHRHITFRKFCGCIIGLLHADHVGEVIDQFPLELFCKIAFDLLGSRAT